MKSLPRAAPLLASAPRGDGLPVLVLPGFTTSDRSIAILRPYLKQIGYDAHSPNLGRNLGPRAIGTEGAKLRHRLNAVHEATVDAQAWLAGAWVALWRGCWTGAFPTWFGR